MITAPPFGASSNIALWRAYSKPLVELLAADLENLISWFYVGENEVVENSENNKVKALVIYWE